MVNKMQNRVRMELIFGSLLIMLFSFFLPRAFISVSLVLFVSCCCILRDFKKQLQHFTNDRFLLAVSLLFFIPFISVLWTSNMEAWIRVISIKLPLLFMPLAFAGAWQLEQKRWTQLAVCFIALCFVGTVWSTINYAQHAAAINENYLRSKMILTPLEDDHIRFSWMISIGVLICLLLLENAHRYQKTIVFILLVWFVVYLHLLAARTGLLCTYLLLLSYLVWWLVKAGSIKKLIAGFIVLLLLPIFAWLLLPTFKNRLNYIRYDLGIINKGKYLPGGNDGNRIQSYKAGWNILQQHPLGVGAGDVYDQTKAWYAQHIPGMLSNDQLNPNSEWLYYGCIAGWPGLLLFTGIMGAAFFIKGRQMRFYWIALNSITILSFLFDVGLEVQYGVFLYALVILGWYKWYQKVNASDYVFDRHRL